MVLSSGATGQLIVDFLAGVGAIPTHPERASTVGNRGWAVTPSSPFLPLSLPPLSVKTQPLQPKAKVKAIWNHRASGQGGK